MGVWVIYGLKILWKEKFNCITKVGKNSFWSDLVNSCETNFQRFSPHSQMCWTWEHLLSKYNTLHYGWFCSFFVIDCHGLFWHFLAKYGYLSSKYPHLLYLISKLIYICNLVGLLLVSIQMIWNFNSDDFWTIYLKDWS